MSQGHEITEHVNSDPVARPVKNGPSGRFKTRIMSTDKRGTKILARTFFNQLRATGYTSNQIIGIATELIDLVTCELRDEKPSPAQPAAKENVTRA